MWSDRAIHETNPPSPSLTYRNWGRYESLHDNGVSCATWFRCCASRQYPHKAALLINPSQCSKPEYPKEGVGGGPLVKKKRAILMTKGVLSPREREISVAKQVLPLSVLHSMSGKKNQKHH